MMPPNKSVAPRDEALTRRNQELRHLRKLVSQLRRRVAELYMPGDVVVDRIYTTRRAAFDWCMEKGLPLSVENIVIALDELGYLREAAPQQNPGNEQHP